LKYPFKVENEEVVEEEENRGGNNVLMGHVTWSSRGMRRKWWKKSRLPK
jgi:hypothetical protein